MTTRQIAQLLSLLHSRIIKETNIERHQHGAVIVAPNGKVVSIGVNIRGAGFSSRYSIHAEEMALIRAAHKGGIPRGSTILVARLKSQGIWGSSRPCDRCRYLIDSAVNISDVRYT